MSGRAYQAWHCGSCGAELEESRDGAWQCREDGIVYDSHGNVIEQDDEDEEGEG